jgi:hypothetical protein
MIVKTRPRRTRGKPGKYLLDARTCYTSAKSRQRQLMVVVQVSAEENKVLA